MAKDIELGDNLVFYMHPKGSYLLQSSVSSCFGLFFVNFPVLLKMVLSGIEYARTSNTAIALVNAFPSNTMILVDGIKEDEEELRRIIAENPNRVFILTPSQRSVTVQEFLSQRRSIEGVHCDVDVRTTLHALFMIISQVMIRRSLRGRH